MSGDVLRLRLLLTPSLPRALFPPACPLGFQPHSVAVRVGEGGFLHRVADPRRRLPIPRNTTSVSLTGDCVQRKRRRFRTTYLNRGSEPKNGNWGESTL